MQTMFSKNPNFDLDLKFGQFGESWCLALGSEGRMEVKTDRIWSQTGNLWFETESRGKPSGIMVSKSKFWGQAMWVNGSIVGMVVFDTKILKKNLQEMVQSGSARLSVGGDDDTSVGIKVPLSRIQRLLLP